MDVLKAKIPWRGYLCIRIFGGILLLDCQQHGKDEVLQYILRLLCATNSLMLPSIEKKVWRGITHRPFSYQTN